MKILIFDTSNLMMRSLFASNPSPIEKTFDMFKLTFLASLMKTIKENEPDRVIMVQDSESWRKDIYPDYKATRAAKREASVVNFTVFFPVAEEFLKQLEQCFKNIQFIRIPKAEADDIIATLVKNLSNDNIINVSSDKDFYQLFKYKNYSQYDGIKHQFIQVLNPENELLLKIILGDKGDNIPSLKRGVGPKKAQAIIDEDLDLWLTTEGLHERFNENNQLISFECIPNDLTLAIMKSVNTFERGQFDAKQYFKFINKSGLAELMDKLTEYSEIIKGLH